MAKKKYLIISENNLEDAGLLAFDEEEARNLAKMAAGSTPNVKYFVMQATEYGLCEVAPCTFYAPEFLTDTDKQKSKEPNMYREREPVGRLRNETYANWDEFTPAIPTELTPPTPTNPIRVTTGWLANTEAGIVRAYTGQDARQNAQTFTTTLQGEPFNE